ncbi:MAG: cytochrome c oxidase assembly protein, partial [Leifsonia sp.]
MTGPMWHPSQPPTLARLFAVHLQPIPVLPVIALALLVLYLGGVWMLHRHGHAWPVQRSLWWTAGVVTMLTMTATGFDGY